MKKFSLLWLMIAALSVVGEGGWTSRLPPELVQIGSAAFTIRTRPGRDDSGSIVKTVKLPAGEKFILRGQVRILGDGRAFLQAIYRNAAGKTIGWENCAALTGAVGGFRSVELPLFRPGAVEAELQLCFQGGCAGGQADFREIRLALRPHGASGLEAVPGFESAAFYLRGVSVPTEKEFCGMLRFRKLPAGGWVDGGKAVPVPGSGEARVSVVGLEPGTEYEAELAGSSGGKAFRYCRTFRTRSLSVPVAETVILTPEEIQKGVVITRSGTSEGFLRYIAPPGTLLVAGAQAEAAIRLEGVRYVILENLSVSGGGRHGIVLSNSSDVRVVNCDISGFGRAGVHRPDLDGKFYDGKNAVNYDSGIFIDGSSDVLIERCFIHAPRGTANPWFFSHPAGPCALFVRSSGGVSLRYNDLIGSDFHRWNDGVEGHNNSSFFGGFRKDAEICGNSILFGNDDGIELDGGQMNCRFFNNRVENFLCGISLAPCHEGPSYVIDNRFLFPGDVWGARLAMVKNSFGMLPGGKLHVAGNAAAGSFQVGFSGFGSIKPTAGFEHETKAEIRNNFFSAPVAIDPMALKANIVERGNHSGGKEPQGSLPERPWKFQVDRSSLFLTSGGSGEVKLTAEPGFSADFSVIGVQDHGFFSVTPSSGKISGGKTLTLKVGISSKLDSRLHRGAFLIRLADGSSRPVSVYGDGVDFRRPLPGVKIDRFVCDRTVKRVPGMESDRGGVLFHGVSSGAKAEFEIPESGKYFLFARTNSVGYASLNLSFDDAPERKHSLYRSAGTWGYTPLSSGTRGSFFSGGSNPPLEFSAGMHSLKITPRSELCFDAFYLVPEKYLYHFLQPLNFRRKK